MPYAVCLRFSSPHTLMSLMLIRHWCQLMRPLAIFCYAIPQYAYYVLSLLRCDAAAAAAYAIDTYYDEIIFSLIDSADERCFRWLFIATLIILPMSHLFHFLRYFIFAIYFHYWYITLRPFSYADKPPGHWCRRFHYMSHFIAATVLIRHIGQPPYWYADATPILMKRFSWCCHTLIRWWLTPLLMPMFLTLILPQPRLYWHYWYYSYAAESLSCIDYADTPLLLYFSFHHAIDADTPFSSIADTQYWWCHSRLSRQHCHATFSLSHYADGHFLRFSSLIDAATLIGCRFRCPADTPRLISPDIGWPAERGREYIV